MTKREVVAGAWRELLASSHPEWSKQALRAAEKALLQEGAIGNRQHPRHEDALAEYRAIVKHIVELSAKESAHG